MKLFGVKTVDEALAALSGALDDLDGVKLAQYEKANEARRRIAELATERDTAEAEAERADRVSTKIRELLA